MTQNFVIWFTGKPYVKFYDKNAPNFILPGSSPKSPL